MRVMYIAFDGEEFDTEWECADYENALKKRYFGFTDFLYFDNCGREIPLWKIDDEDELSRVLDIAFFVVLKRNPTDEELDYVLNDLGVTFPREKGVWRYDSKENEWRDYETEYKAFIANWPQNVIRTSAN